MMTAGRTAAAHWKTAESRWSSAGMRSSAAAAAARSWPTAGKRPAAGGSWSLRILQQRRRERLYRGH